MTVDHEGDEGRGSLHPPDRIAHGAASTKGEPTPVQPTRQQSRALLQVAANELAATRRRFLPPPVTRAQNKDADRGVSDPIPSAGWSPRALPKGSLTPLVPVSVPRAMSRGRLRKHGSLSAFIRLAAAAGT